MRHSRFCRVLVCATGIALLIYYLTNRECTSDIRQRRLDSSQSNLNQLDTKVVLGSKVRVSEAQLINSKQVQQLNTSGNSRTPIENVEPMLYVYSAGRFGNHLFQFASLYGIAKATNRTPRIPAKIFEDLEKYFKDVEIRISSYNVSLVPVLREQGAGKYTQNLLDLPRTSTPVVLCCYLQSWRYFQHYESELRSLLAFTDIVFRGSQDALYRLVKNWREISPSNLTKVSTSDLTFVGVHVRRGDVASESSQKYGYLPAPAWYYLMAMDHFRLLHKNVVFIVCSDEMSWTQRNLPSSGDVIFSFEGALDFSILAMCNHTVMSVGSYGWWAAWLAGGDVVYYKDWPKQGTPLGYMYNKIDYFPPHWLGIGKDEHFEQAHRWSAIGMIM